MVIYCNDGNYYCNVSNWDWTQQAGETASIQLHHASLVSPRIAPFNPCLFIFHREISQLSARTRSINFAAKQWVVPSLTPPLPFGDRRLKLLVC
jgi:hypothetical protein